MVHAKVKYLISASIALRQYMPFMLLPLIRNRDFLTKPLKLETLLGAYSDPTLLYLLSVCLFNHSHPSPPTTSPLIHEKRAQC